MYEMTGLYSEAQDDSSGDIAQDTESDSLPSTTNVNGLPMATTVSTTLTNPSVTTTSVTTTPDTVIKCHSRQPSAGIVDHREPYHDDDDDDDDEKMSKDCGILSCRPAKIQKLARIKVRFSLFQLAFLCVENSNYILFFSLFFFSVQIFVLLLSMLVTLQQALSSGYINSVITTIEKRFDIPSSLSGLIASCYEIGNVVTVIFVSYLGSRRHIPVWIGVGKFNI